MERSDTPGKITPRPAHPEGVHVPRLLPHVSLIALDPVLPEQHPHLILEIDPCVVFLLPGEVRREILYPGLTNREREVPVLPREPA